MVLWLFNQLSPLHLHWHQKNDFLCIIPIITNYLLSTLHDDIKWPSNLYIGAQHAYSVPMWICVCVWFCTCSTALQETLTSPPFTETFSFSVCALYPGLSLQIPGLFAETAARTMWFYSETDARRLPHIRTTPGHLHNHLQMHPQTHFQNRAHKCPSCSESKKTILYAIPVNTCADLTAFLSICPDLCICVCVWMTFHWHTDILSMS